MSKEEVIEKIKHIDRCKDSGDTYTREEVEAIGHLEKMKEYRTIMCMDWSDGEILLKLINKRQKEIEELKKQNYEIVKELKPRVQIDDTEYIERNFISKDKIREKLKEIDGKGTFDAKIVLEHLLKEN